MLILEPDISSSIFDVVINLPNVAGTTTIEQVSVPTPGKHNVLNCYWCRT